MTTEYACIGIFVFMYLNFYITRARRRAAKDKGEKGGRLGIEGGRGMGFEPESKKNTF